eukprot:m.164620 g.164620  ORF g.164620 m.164620 type:complete len:287 (+) comp23954_c0_seq2:81-941(+)
MRVVTVAATQFRCSDDPAENVKTAERLVREAAGKRATLILLQELFETVYFCKDQDPAHFSLARPLDNHPIIEQFRLLAIELGVVLPISYFEQDGNVHFNSLVVIDSDGTVMQNYRKTHIPDGPGYQEKYYFTPGDTGFQVWDTAVGKIGCAICWDQWFPEAARAMVLMGAEILLFPTAIGTEPPPAPAIDSSGPWRRVMQGHAAANVVPVITSNRVGREVGATCEITFYGKSFITDETGEVVAHAADEDGAVLVASFDLDAIRTSRLGWGLFRDRRPAMYTKLRTH